MYCINYIFRQACIYSIMMVSLFTLSHCKQQDVFDITGIWEFSLYYDDQSGNGTNTPKIEFKFSGTQSSGDISREQLSGFQSGTYEVSQDTIHFTFNYGHGVAWSSSEYNGIIASDNTMSGTFTSILGNGQNPETTSTGSWQAVKIQ